MSIERCGYLHKIPQTEDYTNKTEDIEFKLFSYFDIIY